MSARRATFARTVAVGCAVAGAVGRTTPKFVTTGRGPVGLSFSVPRTLTLPSVGVVNS